jgi:hypothetical protein
MTRILTFWLMLALLGVARDASPSRVTRKGAIATAEEYVRLEWNASEANILHGHAKRGIRVDTPDEGYRPANSRPGWWKVDSSNIGMPYKWGGFDTPESFLAGLRRGRAAGDVYTVEKRRLLEAGVSEEAVGIDCSGLISRCWRLPKAYSTRTLQTLCDPIAIADLRPGDILNTNNSHVLLFAGWVKQDRERLRAYEAGSPPTWKVLLNEMGTKWLLDQGYQAWRYRGMRD